MFSRLLCLASLVLLTCFVFAYAKTATMDAINFVKSKQHLLFGNESVEIFPLVRIFHNGKPYWVVSVLGVEGLSGFVPLRDAESSEGIEVASGKLARKQLIKTAHFLRLYSKLKADFSKQGIWPFKNTDVVFFNALSRELSNERVDVTTIESELESNGYASLAAAAAALRNSLDELSQLSERVATKMNEFKGVEEAFFSRPDTNALSDFVKALDEIFSLIDSFDSKRLVYFADVDGLQQGIAQTRLGIETKQGLNNLANVPLKMVGVSDRITNALNLEEKVHEAYSIALNQSDNFVKDLEVREKRSEAWLAMYGFDSGVVAAASKRMQQNVSSLADIVSIVLDERNLFKWRDQSGVSLLQENWSKAKAYYENGSFDSAKKFAEESKHYALRVFEAGLVEEQATVNTDLLVTVAVLLIGLLIVLYVLRNRERLLAFNFVKREEVPINELEK